MSNKDETPEYELIKWMGTAPVFLAPETVDTDKMIKDIRSQGYSIFYVLGKHKESTSTVKGKATIYATKEKPALFKVVQNLVGCSVSQVEDDSINDFLGNVTTFATFGLPKIPFSLIQDVDDFFHEIDRIHKTEAVILFTYDQSYKDTDNPEEGWGVIVPKQSNTAGSCKYEPDSVTDDIPDDKFDDIFIVGSAHSHPGMDAYCSHTDAKDQSDFDGVHITFGWKGDGPTEYHIGLQIAGNEYSLKKSQIFDGYIKEVKNERIEPWKKKVKPKTTVPKSQYTSGTGLPSSFSSHAKDLKKTIERNLPEGLPAPGDNDVVIISPLLGFKYTSKSVSRTCLLCESKMTHWAIKTGKCNTCRALYFNDDIQTPLELYLHLKSKNIPCKELEWTDNKDAHVPKNVWLWSEEIGDSTTLAVEDDVRLLMPMSDKSTKTKGSAKKADGDDGSNLIPFEVAYYTCSFCMSELHQFYDVDNSGSPWCAQCGCSVRFEDLAMFYELAEECRESNTESADTSAATADTSTATMACCDSDKKWCRCAFPITYDQGIEDLVMDNYIDIYKPDSDCKICIFKDTSICPELKKWVHEYVNYVRPEDIADAFEDIERSVESCDSFSVSKYLTHSSGEDKI